MPAPFDLIIRKAGLRGQSNLQDIAIQNGKMLNRDSFIAVVSSSSESKRAARALISRPLSQTQTTKNRHSKMAIKSAAPKNYEHGRIHPATRTFQALRIAANGELESIEKVLPQALSAVERGGRLVCISFHSLEDRIVKNLFKEMSAKHKMEILTPKPITATEKEIQNNPRSRSAKLRAALIK